MQHKKVQDKIAKHQDSATLISATVKSVTINSTKSTSATSNTEALKQCDINSKIWNRITLK